MTEVKPGGGFPHATEPYDPANVLRTYSVPAGGTSRMHRTLKDIVIPAGTEVDVDAPGTNVHYSTPHASVKIAVTKDITAEWSMDLAEAVETGLVEEIPDEVA